MPKLIHTEVKAAQRSKGLTDADMAARLGKSVSWWRGFLGDLWPAPFPAAVVISDVLGIPLSDLRWVQVHEHRPRREVQP